MDFLIPKAKHLQICRARVISYGNRGKDDWDWVMSSGQLDQYFPNYNPEGECSPEWLRWDEWLGVMRDYNEMRNLATNILGLKSLDDYLVFVKSSSKRARNCVYPFVLSLYYEDEWKDGK
jgi:hypothetical protein